MQVYKNKNKSNLPLPRMEDPTFNSAAAADNLHQAYMEGEATGGVETNPYLISELEGEPRANKQWMNIH